MERFCCWCGKIEYTETCESESLNKVTDALAKRLKKYNNMNNQDIKLAESEGFAIGFGGGAMFIECKKCGKHVGFEEIPFPGTKEQQEEIKPRLFKKAETHKCKEQCSNE